MIATSPAYPFAVIEKTTLGLAVVAVAASGIVWGPMAMAAAAAGGAIGWADLAVIRRLATRALRGAESAGDVPGAAKLAAALVGKMAALFAFVWLAVWVLKLPVLPFALGFSALVLGLLSAGLVIGIKEGRA